MKNRIVRALALCLLVSPLAIQAQTWVGGSGGNVFNVAANWSPASVPGSNASLTFGTTGNTGVGFNNLPYTANSLTFTSAATNPFFINGNGTLTINSGVTTQSGNGGVNFANSLNIAFGGNQTWSTASTVTVGGTVSGGFSLTKTGSGNLILSGNNSYSGGTTISAGKLYLGQFLVSTEPDVLSTPAGSGAITVGSGGTLGAANGDLSLTNNLTLASGGTLGGSPQGGASMEIGGSVTLDATSHTLNLGSKSDVFFSGATTGSSTALTVAGDGTSIAILGGSLSGVTSVTANNAAVAFGNGDVLPTGSIHATGGGYVSVADIGSSTPSVTAFLDKITNASGFNGYIGFDTQEDAGSPTVYNDEINLLSRGFTDGNVRLGSLTSAVLGTGATITPVGQSYDFGGFAAQDGLLVVKSDLTERNSSTTTVSVASPSASGGAPQNGMVLILQGANNDFSGNIDVSFGSVIVDSPISSTTKINLGAYSYAGFTENSGLSFSQFATRIATGGYVGTSSTSILGIDSGEVIGEYVDGGTFNDFHTVGAISLNGFTSIYLGTMTGATVTGAITAPTDGVLRLMNNSGDAPFTLQSAITAGNGVTNGLVVGMDGTEGAIVLGTDNTFGGNTTLLGGKLYVGNGTGSGANSALSSGTLTVTAPTAGDRSVLAADSGSATINNNITVTGTTLRVGTGSDDEGPYVAGGTTLTLSGVISGTGGLETTGITYLGGTNTYTGGTVVRADTTVTNNSGLGTGPVYVGYSDADTPVKSTLTFTTSAPSIGFLADASLVAFNGGTGNINLTGSSPTLTINQTGPQSVGTFSGQFTGNAVAITKSGTGQLALTGANSGQITSVTVTAGSLAIGDAFSVGATFNGNVTLSGGGLFFRPGAGETLVYNGNIGGTSGGVTINGNGTGTTNITGGSSNFTGATSINSGTLRLSGDNLWSNVSNTTVNGGTTLRLDGNQTIRNLSGAGTVNIFTGGKALTVDSTSGTSFSGTLTGGGNLIKAGAQTFTISGTNSYTGNTTVSAGTLAVNSSLFSSPTITVDNGAFLMGTGALNDLVLNGTYRPGLSSAAALTTQDNLTMSSTGLLHMELGSLVRGSGFDALNISNAFTVDGSLSVTFISGFNPVLGDSFDLFNWGSISGTFDTLNLQSLSGGLAWDTSALYTAGVISVTTAAIPEPSTYAALAGLAALGLAAWRRRTAKNQVAMQVTARL